jgi:hypothetical protein
MVTNIHFVLQHKSHPILKLKAHIPSECTSCNTCYLFFLFQTIKVFLLAFFAYALCWLPIHTITIVGDINPFIYDSKLVHVVWLFAQCLAVSNSAINPVIVLGSERMARTIGRQPSSVGRSVNPVRKGSFNLLKSRMNKRRSTQETCY